MPHRASFYHTDEAFCALLSLSLTRISRLIDEEVGDRPIVTDPVQVSRYLRGLF
jgi:hypothetical protein